MLAKLHDLAIHERMTRTLDRGAPPTVDDDLVRQIEEASRKASAKYGFDAMAKRYANGEVGIDIEREIMADIANELRPEFEARFGKREPLDVLADLSAAKGPAPEASEFKRRVDFAMQRLAARLGRLRGR